MKQVRLWQSSSHLSLCRLCINGTHGKLPKFMQKKINEADESRKKLIDGFVNMFGIDKGRKSVDYKTEYL